MIDRIFSPITNRIQAFKNCHKGESCYIFGDGVSIKWFDLSAFPKKITFTLNQFLFHNQASLLNLKYHLLIQPFFFYPYIKLDKQYGGKWYKNKIINKYQEVFREKKNLKYFISLSNYPVLNDSNIFHFYKTMDDSNFDFIQECKLNEIDIFEGVFCASISLAIYMGFKEIVLVGCDYTHKISRSGHWYEKGRGIITLNKNYHTKFLEIAMKYVKIITITLEDKGTIINGISYNKFTNKIASFKENIQIADIETLKLLDTYPGYKVF
jgi:hypothetical protein